MLDLKRLRVFREVARLGSFSGAAAALDYSQPAVSHHVSRLELEVGTQLMERGSRGGTVLTAAGELLLQHAELLLDRMADAEAELAETIHSAKACVRLGAFATASATLVPHAIGAVRRISPQTTFTLIEGEGAETLERLRSRHVDIAIVFDDPLHPLAVDSDIELRYLYDDSMLLALPREHRFSRNNDVVDLADLRDEYWIEGAGRETPCSLILLAACERAGYEPRVAFSSGNYQVVQRLVAAGVGVALVPELAITGADPSVVVRTLGPANLYRRIGVAVRGDGYRSEAVKLMLAQFAEACEMYAAEQPFRTAQPVRV